MKTNLHIRMMAIGLFIFLFAGNNLTAQDTLEWGKYKDNPVLEGFLDPPGSVGSPVVIYDEGIFKMWFYSTGGPTELHQIFYAQSIDGIDWEPIDDPVITSGEVGEWNYEKMPGSVIRVADTLMMWYSGSPDDFNLDISIGYAKRHVDDTDWILHDIPVLVAGDEGEWDETAVFYPVVYYDESAADSEKYKMWYHGFEGTSVWAPGMEGYATSEDGVNWETYEFNPVIELGPDSSFYDTWIIGTSVLYYNDEFHLYFTGWDGLNMRIGYATSTDGKEWIVENNDEPVIDVGEAGAWDDRLARYCTVLFHENAFKMWYTGEGIIGKIGYAKDNTIINVPSQYSTIQAGIDAASDGNIVLVAEGTYYENINFKGKAITVASHFLMDGDTSHISNTIIDGSQPAHPDSASVVYFISEEDTTSVIKGFTIQGGGGTPSSFGDGISGGGVFCAQSGPKIEYNRIINNHCEGGGTFVSGGGIFSDSFDNGLTIIKNNLISDNSCTSYQSGTSAVTGGGISVINDAIIVDNTVTNNYVYGENMMAFGGGIECFTAKYTIKNNYIFDNVAESSGSEAYGGGIYGEDWSEGSLIFGNLIDSNQCLGNQTYGGGISIFYNLGKVKIDKNVINNNDASRGAGIAFFRNFEFEITNNIIMGNEPLGNNSSSFARGGGIYLSLLAKNKSSNNKTGFRNTGVKSNDQPEIKLLENPLPFIANNAITENYSYIGGGIALNSSNPIEFLTFNNIIYDNAAEVNGNAIYISAGSTAYLYNNNIITEEIAGEGLWEGENNIEDDPGFDADGYHLLEGSGCINNGINSIEIDTITYNCPEFDIDGDDRPYNNGIADIGVDEYTTPPDGIFENNATIDDLLLQNSPNPFDETTTISFVLKSDSYVNLSIYDLTGKKIRTLINKNIQTGEHEVIFESMELPPGVYFCVIKANDEIQTAKVVKL